MKKLLLTTLCFISFFGLRSEDAGFNINKEDFDKIYYFLDNMSESDYADFIKAIERCTKNSSLKGSTASYDYDLFLFKNMCSLKVMEAMLLEKKIPYDKDALILVNNDVLVFNLIKMNEQNHNSK
jgi:hypothetical protein